MFFSILQYKNHEFMSEQIACLVDDVHWAGNVAFLWTFQS